VLQLLVIGLHDECDHQSNRTEEKAESKTAAATSALVAKNDAAGDAAQQPDDK
jgi:hypothetical protein